MTFTEKLAAEVDNLIAQQDGSRIALIARDNAARRSAR